MKCIALERERLDGWTIGELELELSEKSKNASVGSILELSIHHQLNTAKAKAKVIIFIKTWRIELDFLSTHLPHPSIHPTHSTLFY